MKSEIHTGLKFWEGLFAIENVICFKKGLYLQEFNLYLPLIFYGSKGLHEHNP